jgi:hypothetical protein
MSFIEDLSSAQAPDTEWLVVHIVFEPLAFLS